MANPPGGAELPGAGCFGTGYDYWGTQTNQKFIGALATLADAGPEADRNWARGRALAALRYELATHITGPAHRADGSQWGRHWLSALGLERMMHGWPSLRDAMDSEASEAMRRVMFDEARWLADDFERGKTRGIVAGRWGGSGCNAPESNIWAGAFLWRVTAMYPDHSRADEYRELAHRFLINGVSVAADADDPTLVAGRPIKDRHVGANFFNHYALDHHGYMNVGYMVICLSNAAMLHFDLKRLGLERPESLDHHQRDLWLATKPMIFDDGRLARLGGDSRIPYTYCHEYLVPALLYVADRFGDEDALALLRRTAGLCETEARVNGDGSFLGTRLAPLARTQPYYYTRIESDRACALSMLAAYLPLIEWGETVDEDSTTAPGDPSVEALNERVALPIDADVVEWIEPEHGAVLHRCPTRLASVAWRGAGGGAQVLCLPPGAGDLADWRLNLVGQVRCLGDLPGKPRRPMRIPLAYDVQRLEGGFLTTATMLEGNHNEVPEGLMLKHQATSHYAVCALPDRHTLLVLHRCVARYRVFTHEVVGVNLNIANDLFNGGTRRLTTAAGDLVLQSPATRDELLTLGGTWLCIDDKVGLIGIAGGDQLSLHRSSDRRGGDLGGLATEIVGFPYRIGLADWNPGATILDTACAALSGVGSEATERFAKHAQSSSPDGGPGLRMVTVRGLDDQTYRLTANLDGPTAPYPGGNPLATGQAVLDVQRNGTWHSLARVTPPPQMPDR